MNTETLDNLSIERFAAFLDGNLNEEDMQDVAAAIDSSNEFSDILKETIQIDELVDLYENNLELLQNEVFDEEFELPIIPNFIHESNSVELSSVSSEESDTIILDKDDTEVGQVFNSETNEDNTTLEPIMERTFAVQEDTHSIDEDFNENPNIQDYI